jgi:hypothetical protein
MASNLTKLDYFYEQRKLTRGNLERDYVKKPRKVGVDINQLAFWLCRVVDNDSLCKLFQLRIGGRDIIVDKVQMVELGLISE